MGYADALRVYDAATADEKVIIAPVLARKLHALRKSGKPIPLDAD